MTEVEAALLVASAAIVAGIARRLGVSAPILLVVVGLAASFVPGLPGYRLSPNLVLTLFLPPLLYSAALDSSYVGIRANLRSITSLSIGLVLVTTVVVGLVAHAVVPGLSLPAAFTLGAVVAPPDAVAATAVGRSLGMPRRVLTILGGESLINDATALTAFRVAVGAAVGGGFSVLSGLGQFVLASAGGLAIGLTVAAVLGWLRSRLHDTLLENTLALLTPFLAYLPAEAAHSSGVLAVVVSGLFLGHHGPRSVTFATRLQAEAIWRMVDFVLESVIFALIGLQLRAIVTALSAYGAGELTSYAVLVTGTVVVLRFGWVFATTYLPRPLPRSPRPASRDRNAAVPWRYPVVISWAGMRGVVSLAAAFAIPLTTGTGAPFPGRELIIFLTFAVIIGTLVVQGLTLPAVVRRLGVRGDPAADHLAEAAAQHAAARAAIERLDRVLVAPGQAAPAEVVQLLREQVERRQLGAWERLGGGRPGQPGREPPSAAYRRLRLEMLAAERAEFVRQRDAGDIDDEVLRTAQRDLDLEEALLTRD